VLLLILEEVAAGPGSSATAWPGRAVPLALEPGQAVVSERYCLHYRLPLGPEVGSDVAPPDWSVGIQISPFEY
jgi:hypothetical protein